MNKTITLLSVFFIAITSGFGQKNVASLHVSPLGFGEFRVSFEREITDKFSVVLNMGVMPEKGLPDNGLLPSVTAADYGQPADFDYGYSRFNLVPEFRFYMNKKDEPKGFYIAPYLRYSKWKLNLGDVYTYKLSNQEFADLPADAYQYVNASDQSIDVNVLLDNVFKQYGVGVQFGVQWLINDMISIDWYFLGLEYDKLALESSVSSPDADYLGIDYRNWEADIQREFDEADDINQYIDDLELDVQSDKIVVTGNTKIPWLRAGIKVGYAF